MCELFGFSCEGNGRADLLLRNFAGHSARNTHGWGIAYYGIDGLVLEKKPETARDSEAFYRAAAGATGGVIISHVRNASRGGQHERNCHPFAESVDGRRWTFAHNGHVDGIAVHPRAGGETDSETVFHMLLDSIHAHGDPYTGIVEGIKGLYEEYEFGRDVRLNFLLTDGDVIYAYNHHPEKPMYHGTRQTSGGRSVIVATQRLDGESWSELPEDYLAVIRQGKITSITGPI